MSPGGRKTTETFKLVRRLVLGEESEVFSPPPGRLEGHILLPVRQASEASDERLFFPPTQGVFVGFLHWSPQGR